MKHAKTKRKTQTSNCTVHVVFSSSFSSYGGRKMTKKKTGLKSSDSTGSLKIPEPERTVPIPGAGRRSSLADIAITLHTQSRGYFEGGVLYAGTHTRRALLILMLRHPLC